MATQSVATGSVRPWVITTPLGTPVVPEVKRMSEGSSGPSAALRRSDLGQGLGVARPDEVLPADGVIRGPLPRATTTVSSAGSSAPVASSMAT